MQQITILGATGSIGMSSINLILQHPQQYSIYALTANTNVEKMQQICRQCQPRFAVMSDLESAKRLKALLADLPIEVLGGQAGLLEVASHDSVDVVIAAIVGSVGLMPTLAAVRSAKRVLLANKESLVMAGDVLMNEVAEYNALLIPVDSEHNAIFQCLPADYAANRAEKGISKILLTGSGGPFRALPLNAFDSISTAQAVTHPNWCMGPKISVDSATMMNKGLELIEACWLFNISDEDIEIVVHKQSIIHSMVAYTDGSVLAQMGNPDMRTPIANALAWPHRIDAGVEPLDLFQIKQLDFEAADENRFPCLKLARDAFKEGGTSMAILNAANEIAVESFLNEQIKFTDIAKLIDHTLQNIPSKAAHDLDVIMEDDDRARHFAQSQVKQNNLGIGY